YLRSFIRPKQKIEPWVRMLLRMSIYQMGFLERVPDHAIIHEAAEIAKRRGHKGIASFVNSVLRNVQRKGGPDTALIEDATKRLSNETRHPEWLVDRWVRLDGFVVTSVMCMANLTKKPLSVRVQPMKISREKEMELLQEEGFNTSASTFSEQGIIIEQGNILTSKLFKEGYVTIQDQSSML